MLIPDHILIYSNFENVSTHMVIQDHMFIWAMYALFMLPCSATTFTRHKLINLTTNFTQDYFVGRELKLKLELNFQYNVGILLHDFSKKKSLLESFSKIIFENKYFLSSLTCVTSSRVTSSISYSKTVVVCATK